MIRVLFTDIRFNVRRRQLDYWNRDLQIETRQVRDMLELSLGTRNHVRIWHDDMFLMSLSLTHIKALERAWTY